MEQKKKKKYAVFTVQVCFVLFFFSFAVTSKCGCNINSAYWQENAESMSFGQL